MDGDTIAILFRGSERLAIVILAGILLYLGYKLFDKAVQVKTKATAEYKKVSMSIESAAPGIFFALFGSVVLCSVVFTKLNTAGDENGGSINWNTDISSIPLGSLSIAISSISLLEEFASTLNEPKRAELFTLHARIEELLPFVIDARYGDGAFRWFSGINELCREANPGCETALTRSEAKQRYQEILSFMEGESQ